MATSVYKQRLATNESMFYFLFDVKCLSKGIFEYFVKNIDSTIDKIGNKVFRFLGMMDQF